MITTFDQLRDSLFALYGAGKLAEAQAMIEQYAPAFPDQLSRTSYWAACVAALLGQQEKAIGVLQGALDQGVWFNPDQLRSDSDLGSLQDMPEFGDLLTTTEAHMAAAQRQTRPLMATLPKPAAPSPYPLLLALHGNNGNMPTTLPFWQSARDHGWLVALAQSGTIVATEMYSWNDWERGVAELGQHLADLAHMQQIDTGKIVIGGFSMGAGLAAWAALSGAIDVAGVVAVGPYIADLSLLDDLRTDRSLRYAIVVGANDTMCLPMAQRLADRASAAGHTGTFEIIPDVAHSFPADWPARLAAFLDTFTTGA